MNNLMRDFFDFLNSHCRYIVLRNWDILHDENIHGKTHEDIDILCESLDLFVEITGAHRIHKEKNRDNYIVLFQDTEIRIDVRWIGDGYYPADMEKKMLLNRVLNEQSIYVPATEDYFYSLLYHALIQKPYLSEEYRIKLCSIHKTLSEVNRVQKDISFQDALYGYIKTNGWSIEYPLDPGVYINKDIIKEFPINKNFSRQCSRYCLIINQRLSYYIKRFFHQK